MENRLPLFIKETFEHEGVFQKHPADPGNYYQGKLYGTIYGIAAKYHFKEFMDIHTLWASGKTLEARAAAVKFYQTSEYWNPLYDQIFDSSLAFRIWDFGINSGAENAVKLLQETLNKYNRIQLSIDGKFGNKTLVTTNISSIPVFGSSEETEFYYAYVKRLDQYYRSLKRFIEFGSGWISRANKIFNGCPNLYQVPPAVRN